MKLYFMSYCRAICDYNVLCKCQKRCTYARGILDWPEVVMSYITRIRTNFGVQSSLEMVKCCKNNK